MSQSLRHFPNSLVLLWILLAGLVRAPSSSTLLDSVSQALIRQDYTKATKELCVPLSSLRENLDKTYLSLAIRQAEIMDYESYELFSREMISKSDSIITVITTQLPRLRGADSTTALFYLGNALGCKSIFLAKESQWIPSIQCALSSVNYLHAAQKQNPFCFAAYLGTGIYNYYLSVNFKWIPLFGDHSAEGLKDIRTAAKAPIPYDLAAKNSLCWIYIDRKDYLRSDSVAAATLITYPDHTVFLRARAHSTFYLQKWALADSIAWRLVTISKKRTPVNWSDMVSGYYIAIKTAEARKQKGHLIQLCNEALNCGIPASYASLPYVHQNLKDIRETLTRHAGAVIESR